MIALANTGHPRAKELRDKADAFDRANHGVFLDPPTHTRRLSSTDVWGVPADSTNCAEAC
jgi:hypothetical protein